MRQFHPHAQVSDPEVKQPAFAVVSVKRNKMDGARPALTLTADGISLRRYQLSWIVVAASGLQEQRRIIGAPSWTQDEYYDIEAKVDEADVAAFAKLSSPQRWDMLQQVLVERFGLKYHFESRDFPSFNLVIAKGGPKLTESKPDTKPYAMPTGHLQMEYRHLSMQNLCNMALSTEAQALVIDKTGLTGTYDFTLHWSRSDEVNSDEPLIFTAVQEQLGLKMVPVIVPTKVWVIDHIERPPEN